MCVIKNNIKSQLKCGTQKFHTISCLSNCLIKPAIATSFGRILNTIYVRLLTRIDLNPICSICSKAFTQLEVLSAVFSRSKNCKQGIIQKKCTRLHRLHSVIVLLALLWCKSVSMCTLYLLTQVLLISEKLFGNQTVPGNCSQ